MREMADGPVFDRARDGLKAAAAAAEETTILLFSCRDEAVGRGLGSASELLSCSPSMRRNFSFALAGNRPLLHIRGFFYSAQQ